MPYGIQHRQQIHREPVQEVKRYVALCFIYSIKVVGFACTFQIYFRVLFEINVKEVSFK